MTPIGGTTMKAAVAEVRAKSVPGLYLPEVDDAELAQLKGLTKLRRLDLRGTEVTDAGLAHLKGLTELRWLLLLGTDVTDAGLAHLMGLTELQLLVLDGTEVTDKGVEELQKALPGLHVLR